MDIKYTTPIKVEIYGNGGSPEKETTTPKTVEEVVDAIVNEFEFIFTPIYKFAPADTVTFKENSSDWMKNKLTFLLTEQNQAADERLREAVKEILNNQKRIMAVATKDISPQAAEGAIVFVDIVTVDDIKTIAANRGTPNL